jgi:hypothetical protein
MNMAVEILSPPEREVMILNLVREINGKPVVFNDIRNLPISLYIEEVPDYQSSFAEQKATFESLLSNAHAQWLMLSPELLRRMGVRNPEQIASEMQQAMQQKTMMEESVAGRGNSIQPSQGQGNPTQTLKQQPI